MQKREEKEELEEIYGLLPEGYEEKARELRAYVRPLEGFGGVNELLRAILMHACGLSLKETALRLEKAGVGKISSVGLFKRLRAAERWLHWMAQGLFGEGKEADVPVNRRVRLVDATVVKEQGVTGSCWRLHWSMDLATLQCDFFELSDQRKGESLRNFPLHKGDLVVADGGYASSKSVAHAKSLGADLLVRLRKNSRWLLKENAEEMNLPETLRTLKKENQVNAWPVWVKQENGPPIRARLIAMRLDDTAFARGVKKAKRKAGQHGGTLSEQAREMRRYLTLLCTVPEEELSTQAALELYRRRWQIELAFKRQKSILNMGCVPKSDPASARAWLYGKLILGLLLERLKDRGDYLFIEQLQNPQEQRIQSVA